MPDELLEISEEEKELLEIKLRFISYPKLGRWVDLYFDEENNYKLSTYMNKALSAIYAYDLDPHNPDDKKYAIELGSKNARKCKDWAQRYYEIKGFTREKVLDLIAAHATGGKALALKMLASIMEIYEEKPNIIIQNTQINNTTAILNEQISPEELAARKKEFADFINDKYKTSSPSNPSAPEVATD